jgi:hypothetical protein
MVFLVWIQPAGFYIVINIRLVLFSWGMTVCSLTASSTISFHDQVLLRLEWHNSFFFIAAIELR